MLHVHGTVGAQHCLVDNIFDELLNLTEMYLGSRSVMYLEVQAPLSQGRSVVGGGSGENQHRAFSKLCIFSILTFTADSPYDNMNGIIRSEGCGLRCSLANSDTETASSDTDTEQQPDFPAPHCFI